MVSNAYTTLTYCLSIVAFAIFVTLPVIGATEATEETDLGRPTAHLRVSQTGTAEVSRQKTAKRRAINMATHRTTRQLHGRRRANSPKQPKGKTGNPPIRDSGSKKGSGSEEYVATYDNQGGVLYTRGVINISGLVLPKRIDVIGGTADSVEYATTRLRLSNNTVQQANSEGVKLYTLPCDLCMHWDGGECYANLTEIGLACQDELRRDRQLEQPRVGETDRGLWVVLDIDTMTTRPSRKYVYTVAYVNINPKGEAAYIPSPVGGGAKLTDGAIHGWGDKKRNDYGVSYQDVLFVVREDIDTAPNALEIEIPSSWNNVQGEFAVIVFSGIMANVDGYTFTSASLPGASVELNPVIATAVFCASSVQEGKKMVVYLGKDRTKPSTRFRRFSGKDWELAISGGIAEVGLEYFKQIVEACAGSAMLGTFAKALLEKAIELSEHDRGNRKLTGGLVQEFSVAVTTRGRYKVEVSAGDGQWLEVDQHGYCTRIDIYTYKVVFICDRGITSNSFTMIVFAEPDEAFARVRVSFDGAGTGTASVESLAADGSTGLRIKTTGFGIRTSGGRYWTLGFGREVVLEEGPS